MKTLSKILRATACVLLVVPMSLYAGGGRGGGGGGGGGWGGGGGGGPNNATLDAAEETHLVYMRQEEKLARDVYLTFAEWYPYQTVFNTIATISEQTHTDTMREKLAQFGLPDPEPEANDLPEYIGVFTGEPYGDFFTETFDALTDEGRLSELHALYVGAFIEELDMHDIVECPDIIVDMDNGIEEGGCGLNYTDARALINSYNGLLDGSENHLRAFVGQIEAVIGIGNYEAQYLSQEEVDEILGR